MGYVQGYPDRDARRLSPPVAAARRAGLALGDLWRRCGHAGSLPGLREAGRSRGAPRSRPRPTKPAEASASRPTTRSPAAPGAAQPTAPARRRAGRQAGRARRAALRLVGLAGPPQPDDQGDRAVPAEEPRHQGQLRVRRVPGLLDEDDHPGDGRQPARPDAAGLRLDLAVGRQQAAARRWTTTSPSRSIDLSTVPKNRSTAAGSTASCTP